MSFDTLTTIALYSSLVIVAAGGVAIAGICFLVIRNWSQQ